MSILHYCKPVTGNNVPTPDKAGLSASITKGGEPVNGERAIAGNRGALDDGAKDKYDKYAAENGNAAAIKRFMPSHYTGESTP